MNDKERRSRSVEKESSNLLQGNVTLLKELFPEAVTEEKIDFAKLRESLGDEVDDRPERYSFTWAGKRDAIRLLQTPSRATLIPVPKESVNFDQTNNIFIEGENLEALKLLYKAYAGQVKMIYIDPPYNTGNDFIYPDNYADPLDTYLKLTGQKDSEGNLLTSNPETSGRYHSAWLTMMYPRLFIARQLLCEGGLIFVSIDDNEVANLRLMMNEVFGEENFIAQLIWKSRQFLDSRAVTHVSTDHEYILVYARQEGGSFRGTERDESKFSNPDNDIRGPWMSRSLLGLATKEQRPNLHFTIVDPQTDNSFDPPSSTGWRYSPERMAELIRDGRILFPSTSKGRPREKKFRLDIQREFASFPSLINDVHTADGTAEIRELFGFQAFDFPKPSELLRRLIDQSTRDEEIILDCFGGSCPTAHAALTQNRMDQGRRRFICIQLPEPVEEKSELKTRGFKHIADIGKERIRRVIKKLKEESEGKLALKNLDTPEDLGFKVFKLAESNYRPWKGVEDKDGEKYAKTMEMFADPLLPGWKPVNVIYEVALKEGYSLTCNIEELRDFQDNAVYRVTDSEKNQSFRICLDNGVKEATIKALNLAKDDLFICRDMALTDDQAVNLALQCNLKTI